MSHPLVARYLVPSLIVTGIVIACGGEDADAQDPAPAPAPAAQKVVVMNTSAQPWTGMTVMVDGVPACQVADLAPGGSVTVSQGRCETFVPPEAAVAEAAPEQAVAPAPAAGAAPVERSSAPAAATLHGTAKVTGGFGPARRVGVTNQDSFDWNKCTVTLNGEWGYHMPHLSAGEYEGIMGGRFKNSTGDMMTKNHQITAVRISCNEGSGTFQP